MKCSSGAGSQAAARLITGLLESGDQDDDSQGKQNEDNPHDRGDIL